MGTVTATVCWSSTQIGDVVFYRTVLLNLRDQDLRRQRDETPLDVTTEDKQLDVTTEDEDMWDNWDEEQLSLSEGTYALPQVGGAFLGLGRDVVSQYSSL